MPTVQFSQEQLDRLSNEVLTLIEIEESRLLNWGFVDTRTDLQDRLPQIIANLPASWLEQWQAAAAAGVTVEDVLANLMQRKLVFAGPGYHRTRFAEAIRLLYLMRQLFKTTDWYTGNRLVSDLKLNLQRRRYPRRDLPAQQFLVELFGQTDQQRLSMVSALLQGSDGALSLARFQRAAASQLFRDLHQNHDCGLVVGAGTGAGKTKAFYIPALAEIAATLSAQRWVRALAIYPRIELLKDQLIEAYQEVRKLDAPLKQRGQRPVALGAYYGDTPISAQSFLDWQHKVWASTKERDGWICPFFTACPNPNCSSRQLVWYRIDVEKEAQENKKEQFGSYARLRCPKCHTTVAAQQLLLTREQMVRQPPDLLFTTTEMLNRRLTKVEEHQLFGVNTRTPPRLVLLDEIHTYEGVHGAQVGYLLRRWRHMRGYTPGANLCIVGLSATLTQAESFFSKLTGLPQYYVNYVAPADTDMIEEGIEYNLVLKGDPVSGAALLSTSVQTAMLLGRMLDPLTEDGDGANLPSCGAYGQKTFAFTDKLDVINRWYHIEIDAEEKQKLAALRAPLSELKPAIQQQRYQMGQDWRVCALIGHDLNKPLRVGLTSSQHRGVKANAELIIATSTLEVGFNDLTVGAVLQHKAPRSMASFLQRKGRAGRVRSMRPWTVVVASAYGRDRWAFQHAESLFNPLLPPIALPLDNSYVRQIQAAYVLMDWLAVTLGKRGVKYADVWDLLSSDDLGKKDYLSSPRAQICKLLQQLLAGQLMSEFELYLQRALGISDADRQKLVPPLLWGEPRSLLLDVIPTLLRQLSTGWQSVADNVVQPWTDSIAANPMPDFVPANLFSDINTPELRIQIPTRPPARVDQTKKRDSTATRPGAAADGAPQSGGDSTITVAESMAMRTPESLGLLQGMVEFAPTHVNKRFSSAEHTREAFWLELPSFDQLQDDRLPLAALKIVRDEVPNIVRLDQVEYHVYRPRSYTLDFVPLDVVPTSSGRLVWRSHFELRSRNDDLRERGGEVGASDAPAIPLPPGSPVRALIRSVSAYTQADDNWVDVTRMAIGVRVETRYELNKQPEVRRTFSFMDDGRPAALGFTIAVDALEFVLVPLNVQALRSSAAWTSLYPQFGPQFFLHKLQHDERIAAAQLSSFDINWLWQLELSMLVATAVAEASSLQVAAGTVVAKRAELADRTLRVIFQARSADPDAEEEAREGRLHQRLMQHLANPAIAQALTDCHSVLWNDADPELPQWLQWCYACSVGAALLDAVTNLALDIDPDDLTLDVDGDRIWIAEATAGGVGLITQIAATLAQRPRDLDLQLLDSLHHCDREQIAIQLREVAALLEQHQPDLEQVFAQLRATSDLPRQDETRRGLAKILEGHGVPATRELIVALNNKFLRPNSGPDSDQLIASLARHWQQDEQRIGTAIDLRVMAVAARKIPAIERLVQEVLTRIGGAASVDESQIFNLLQSLLWMPCIDSCPDCIEVQPLFQELAHPSRRLLLALIEPGEPPILYKSDGWAERVTSNLSARYIAQVGCDQDMLEECKADLLDILTTPVEVGYQFFYPVIERIARTQQHWVVDLVLRELIRG